jgi:hypothetical protein
MFLVPRGLCLSGFVDSSYLTREATRIRIRCADAGVAVAAPLPAGGTKAAQREF